LKKAKDDRRTALEQYNAASARYKAAFVPLGKNPTPSDIRELASSVPVDTAYVRSHLIVCLSLLVYAPEALFGGKLPLRFAKLVAGVIGVKHESVYIARNKVSAWLRIYPDFLALVSGMFADIRRSKNYL